MNIIVKAIKDPKKAARVLIYRSRSIFGHTSFKRFIILARSRTGSNLLVSFLNSHSNVYSEGEIVSWLHGRDYRSILRRVFGKQPNEILAKGFKIFYYHPQDDDSCKIWDDLVAMDDLVVIHLKRRNILRTLISRKIAGIQGVYSDTPGKRKVNSDKKVVNFTVQDLEEGFQYTRKMETDGDEMFKDHPLLPIYYEDLVNDPEGTFNKVTDLLGVDQIHPQTNFRKQNPEKASTLITNYHELEKAFAGTEWSEFFEE